MDEWTATPKELRDWGVIPGEKPSQYRARREKEERRQRRVDRIVQVILCVVLGPPALLLVHLLFGIGHIVAVIGLYWTVACLGQAWRGE